jgi:murein DD-endopeptidase MepM/ murein hydrolase activator NlpD
VHHGIDYGADAGEDVYAVAAGVVTGAGHSDDAGYFVEVSHRGGYMSRYLHLSSIMQYIENGKNINIIDTLGTVGSTGKSTGPHLHYELYLAGVPISPTSHLPTSTVALGPLAYPAHKALLDSLQKD